MRDLLVPYLSLAATALELTFMAFQLEIGELARKIG